MFQKGDARLIWVKLLIFKDLGTKAQILTLVCRVDYSILISWTSPFFLGVADVLFSFSSYFFIEIPISKQ